MKYYKFFINTLSDKYLFFYKGIEVYAAASKDDALNIFRQNIHDVIAENGNFALAKINDQVLMVSLFQSTTLVVEEQIDK